MPSYWLIRLLLLVGFVLIALVIMRPVRSQSHLAVRRLSILVLLLFAVFAILFPELSTTSPTASEWKEE